MKFDNSILKKTILFLVILLLQGFFFSISYAGETKETSKQPSKSVVDKIAAPQPASKNKHDSLQEHTQVGASNYIQMLLGLFFIIAFIFGIAWLIKRMGTMHPGHSANLKIVAGLSVGQREKIIVLQVMNEQLLVGVTQSNIQLLSTLKDPIDTGNSPTLSGFQDKLQSAISGFTKNNDTEKN